MRERIQTLDGLRFLAALGVLWIHTWTIHGNPRFFIGNVDVANFLAIGVNGVELFFVISGFCMYYFYANNRTFSYHDFYRFLFKRWVRLSPAFYTATIIYIVVKKIFYHYPIDSFANFLHSVFYLDFIYVKYYTASHFWTLTVEFQFYFLMPFLLLYQNKAGFKKIFALIFGSLLLLAVISMLLLKNTNDLFTGTIIFRGIEFGFGILAARLLINNNNFFKTRVLWMLLFIIVTYAGRVFVSKPVLNLSIYYYNFFKIVGFSLMGAGFAGILYLSVTSKKWLNYILGNKVFKTMGRISFSFYLLHALVYPVIYLFTIKYLPFFEGISAPMVTTCISAVILYPISLLSYNLLEKPYLAIGNLSTK